VEWVGSKVDSICATYPQPYQIRFAEKEIVHRLQAILEPPIAKVGALQFGELIRKGGSNGQENAGSEL
jgi:hypothetical protein